MTCRIQQVARFGLLFLCIILAGALAPTSGRSAPYAAMVMDARTGEVLHSRNAETRLHPASLTKMMTLYIAFQAVQRGEISLDSQVRITPEAAREPPSRLGLRAGQTIQLRYLIRAAAVRSANDAATAIGIAISGSEEAFARRMNATARAMGMTSTTFVNAHGLTASGHMSTARDMTVLGRHVIYDFPQYYNLFSRRTADAGIAQVNNTNRRFLDSYQGADGIKTGFTNAAGYNLVASAQRGQERIIATVFGGTSTAQRNATVAELLDLGFARAPSTATLRRPQPPGAVTTAPVPNEPLILSSNQAAPPDGAARTIRVSGLVTRSLRPLSRPGEEPLELETVDETVIDEALTAALEMAKAPSAAPLPLDPSPLPAAAPPALTPEPRPTEIIMTAAAIAPAPATSAEAEVVTRLSTSGDGHWGINVGRFNSRYEAERHLMQVALSESVSLAGGVRRIMQGSTGFDANVTGLSRDAADLACRRLQARGTTCFMMEMGS